MGASHREVLPDMVKPSHYELSLYDLELGGAFTFQGTVKITINITSPVQEILLNAHQLKLNSASIAGNGISTQKASEILYIEKDQRASLRFSEKVNPTNGAVLDIQYSGVMNNDMAGFYRSRYISKVEPPASVPRVGDSHFMFSTQFESCSARWALPCFDEPNLKATFDFQLEIPDDLVALSNMPEKETKKASDGKKVVSFERTPVMSTYLLAWAFGDFEYVEGKTERTYGGKQLPVRVYTTRGLKEQGRFALKNAGEVVDYFSEIFGIDYPLPKADLLAVHEFSLGAMENWGLVTYRTTAVLFDEEHSDAKYRVRVAYVVAHELAHQWFGNLVTMDWWSELWLNEGFATWVGWLATDHIHPEYRVWTQFVTEAMQQAQQLDSLRSSHPIEVPVNDALEIDQIFDAISYLKGSSVIRMLSNHLSVEVFLKGVSEYLKAHAYGNATTNDLWSALSKASGRDVNTFMDPWIRKIGYPVLTVAEEPGQIGLRQSRFLSTGDIKATEDDTLWWIPLGLKTDPNDTGASPKALTEKQETLRDVDEKFYKLNTEQTGFYRTNYPPARLAKLGESKDKLTDEDKIGLIADAAALAVSGDGTTAALLSFVENFKDETSYAVWSQLISSLSNVRSVFASNETISKGLKTFTLRLVETATEKIGWDFKSNEDFLTGQLRALLIGTAGLAGHQPTIETALSLFKSYMSESDSSTIHPSLRLPIFRIAIAEDPTPTTYNALKNEYLTTTSIDGREICLQAMGRVQSASLATDFLNFQFSDKVAVQDLHTGSIALAANSKTRDVFWEWVQSHWGAVLGKMTGRMVVMDRFLKNTLGRFASFERAEEIENFFKDKDTRGFDRGLVQVGDAIRGNAGYREREEAKVEEWLGVKGYL